MPRGNCLDLGDTLLSVIHTPTVFFEPYLLFISSKVLLTRATSYFTRGVRFPNPQGRVAGDPQSSVDNSLEIGNMNEPVRGELK